MKQLILSRPNKPYIGNKNVLDWYFDYVMKNLKPLLPCKIKVTYSFSGEEVVFTGICTGIDLGQLQFYKEAIDGEYARIGLGLVKSILVL